MKRLLINFPIPPPIPLIDTGSSSQFRSQSSSPPVSSLPELWSDYKSELLYSLSLDKIFIISSASHLLQMLNLIFL